MEAGNRNLAVVNTPMVLGPTGLAKMTREGRVDRKEVQGSYSNIKSSEKRRNQQRRQRRTFWGKMHVLQI